MYYAQFSYWLNVIGKDAGKAADLLEADGILECSFIADNREMAEFCVPEGEGTMEEWMDMENVIRRISMECPNADFSMFAINEETKEEHILGFRNGRKVEDKYSRIVPAQAKYDEPTVRLVLGILQDKGFEEAAKALQEELGR